MGPYRISKRSVYLGPDLDSAVTTYLGDTGTEFNALVRTAIAKEIGKPELGESVKMGRPTSPPESPVKETTRPLASTAPKKKAAKKKMP